MNDDDKNADVEIAVYSDDCVNITDVDTDEYSLRGHWLVLEQNDKPVGMLRVDFEDGGWTVRLKSNGEPFSVRLPLGFKSFYTHED